MADTLRLFLVEDDDDVALLIRRTLERAGHQVASCRTAADALIVLGHSQDEAGRQSGHPNHERFDLVLLDHRLPDMAGLELLQALVREGIAVPCIVVTAHGDEQLAARVLQAGALDYVVKDPALTFLGELPKRVSESVTKHGLQQMNRLLVESLESASDGIMITDLQGTIIKVNRALEALTGYSREELIGQNPRLFKSGIHSDQVYVDLWNRILARQSWEGELTNRKKDGTLFPVSLSISPIVDSHGQLTHFVGIQRDITERKQLERQLLQAQKMQSVGTLAGGVAHEFNNLLAGINGYAALGLREANVRPTVREFMRYIVDLSERAATLTRQLLAFARKPALARKPTAIGELVRSTADLVTRTLHADVVEEIQDLTDQNAPLLVHADANQLQQALVNLALNARDARDAREPESPASDGPRTPVENTPLRPRPMPMIVFRVSHKILTGERAAFPQSVPQGDYVLLEVIDHGKGMSPEVLNQALDPFFTTKEVGQGTGLGLPMVFGIVQGHQGFLTIESEEDRGTTVGLYLPRLRDSSRPGDEEQLFMSGQILEPEATPGRSILVIDDEEAVLDVVRRFLEIAGHRVTCATSGQEGMRLLDSGRETDLVILDLMMPREDTSHTYLALRQRWPQLPILLCTGQPSNSVAQFVQGEEIHVLRKPFRMNELWYAVKQAMA
jgi:PAS domain S-box-containing protein